MGEGNRSQEVHAMSTSDKVKCLRDTVMEALAREGKAAGMAWTGSVTSSSVEIDGVPIHFRSKGDWCGFDRVDKCRLRVGDYGEVRSFPVAPDGKANFPKILDHIRRITLQEKKRKASHREAEKQRKIDEQLTKKLTRMLTMSRVSIACERGKAHVEVTDLNEAEALRVISAISAVLLPAPEIGDIWQHKKVKHPSKVVSTQGMIKLEANGHTCAIPRREFVEDWERVEDSSCECQEPVSDR